MISSNVLAIRKYLLQSSSGLLVSSEKVLVSSSELISSSWELILSSSEVVASSSELIGISSGAECACEAPFLCSSIEKSATHVLTRLVRPLECRLFFPTQLLIAHGL